MYLKWVFGDFYNFLQLYLLHLISDTDSHLKIKIKREGYTDNIHLTIHK